MSFIVDLATAKAQFQQYEFIKPLTPSAQKAAFHVRDTTGRELCLKLISPTYEIDRLQREIEAMLNLDHPSVVKLVEYTFSTSSSASRHYVVEEFVEGTDLSDRLTAPWPRRRVSEVFARLCDGLEQIHQKLIVHRDLKPTNVRLKPDDTPVVIDFGLSRHLLLADLTTTADGAQIGTPKYFSPEQFQGTKHDIDHRTDLFAVGVMLHEALLGQHPFWTGGMTRAALQDRVCHSNDYQSSTHYRALPSEWQMFLSRMMSKTRVSRISNASQAAALLRKLENI